MNHFNHFDPQAHPRELARHVPSHALHLRAINNAFKCARNDILYVRHALAAEEDDTWAFVMDTVAACLSGATLRLAGGLDALVILENSHADPSFIPASSMTFCRTSFKNVAMQSIQEQMKALKSPTDEQIRDCRNTQVVAYADFWTLADFWKHCFPYQPKPSVSEQQGLRDFVVNLHGGDSGPIMHDLIYPVFNAAVDIVHKLARVIGAPVDIDLVCPI